MSFALEVKEEVVSHSFSLKQQTAFLSGFVSHNAEIIYSNNREKLKLTTISNRIARSILTFVKAQFEGDIQISIIQSQTLKKNKVFQITMIGDIKKFLKNINIFDDQNTKINVVPDEWVENDEIFRPYVAGVFVATGSVNSPATSNYHLELQFKTFDDAQYFESLMREYHFDFKTLERSSNRYINYIKKALLVSDFLKFIDAPQSVMKFENERISRDMVNNINRMSNIDISNLSKTLKTAEKQVEQIKYIQKKNKLNKLSEKGQVLALLRLKKPEYSYLELGMLMEKQGFVLTKSGIANLFRNIDKLYKMLIEENNK